MCYLMTSQHHKSKPVFSAIKVCHAPIYPLDIVHTIISQKKKQAYIKHDGPITQLNHRAIGPFRNYNLLTPVASYPKVASGAMAPMAWHPNHAGVWRQGPATTVPYIVATSPCPVFINPYMARTWSYHTHIMRAGRANGDPYLRRAAEATATQGYDSAQQKDLRVFHVLSVLVFLEIQNSYLF